MVGERQPDPPLRVQELLERLERVGADLEQVARAMTLGEEDLLRVVEALERAPWLVRDRAKP